jgi:hypothetical protein
MRLKRYGADACVLQQNDAVHPNLNNIADAPAAAADSVEPT